jgi:hypothetical protein
MHLSSRFSRLVVFLACSDVPTFSPDFNGLTVTSTVNFGATELASCELSHALIQQIGAAIIASDVAGFNRRVAMRSSATSS